MASSAGLTPLPTSVHHSTTRLTHYHAHSFLSEFLDRAENDAAYRPDSTLTERGPQALSSGSTPNLTLSHLKRILSGMEGKRIGGSLGLEEEAKGTSENTGDDEELGGLGGTEEGQTPRKRGSQKRALDEDDENEDPQAPGSKKQKRKIIYSINQEGVEDPQVSAEVEAGAALDQDRGEDDWQDAETYALAQTELREYDTAKDEPQPELEVENIDDERDSEEPEAVEHDNSDGAEQQTQTQTTARKREQREVDEDADADRGAQKANKKKAKDTGTAQPTATATKNNQEVSKEERRKMKKMRRKDEKKERQREREERNKNR
ncbi:hypothetical protein Z517_02123 [Fonsecaea pedrosoi CBS 271.37]|uniref:Uncharacterized protein n=1 Tax=Fonsecaea pedrosoi CBS 271.37 TaxID=1442368 RepID=A0A0D2GW84_9EURO|nr:uncharacterized protein Z517_02123 [Fonsecaea pedrosoi CBS 271.37]KIW82880.1 hypothetical protein Z517_02123 [Fonsecaea pedrosoi CBS 271.37]